MNSVERLELAIAEAQKRGLEVRMEPLQGTAGGLCEFGRKKWIFVDMTAPVLDQLEQILSALRQVNSRSVTKPAASKVEAA